jgi:hypothetical protein
LNHPEGGRIIGKFAMLSTGKTGKQKREERRKEREQERRMGLSKRGRESVVAQRHSREFGYPLFNWHL